MDLDAAQAVVERACEQFKVHKEGGCCHPVLLPLLLLSRAAAMYGF